MNFNLFGSDVKLKIPELKKGKILIVLSKLLLFEVG